jgi:predicted GTPase
MEELMAAPVEEGDQPKSVAQIVAKVLTKECPSSTFLQNVGLEKSLSKNKIIRSGAVVAAQVTDLQDKLERSELQGEAMREELAVLKKKSQDAKAAQAKRDEEHDLLVRRLEESDERFNHLLGLLASKATGIGK